MPAQPSQGPSFLQQYAFVQWGIQFPALTVITILRRDIGYRLVHPLKLIAVMGLLAVIAILAMPGNEDARPVDLLIFALISFALGIYQRIRRWFEMNSGVMEFTYYVGSSPFDFRWLPNFVRRNRRVARYVDPIFCAALGLALFPFSRALAMWLVFSGLALRSYEDQIFRRERNRDLDLVDSLIITQRQARVFEQYEQTLNERGQQTNSGVPTGLGEDIESQIKISIKRRKPKANKPIIDI